jgi:hypothetical protein
MVAELAIRSGRPSTALRPRSTIPTSWTVVIHSYRHRHGNAPGDPRLDAIERRLAPRPAITVPTMILHGAATRWDRPDVTRASCHDFRRGPSAAS